ncbi:hypothetical protein [Flavobacterium sp. HBTb2-11-1]|uniref:hypothetical protein n=1 Tax=Flavobacterium sp. HBTb2-11-1 TaxID=2692212 RepID=UPI001367D486|nr:hypothetical protein [Flavobacterium sp. HBTb2-11-1]MXO04618.1 hypothetical protein [Flavobacterium sp. HBTb2-11-1]
MGSTGSGSFSDYSRRKPISKEEKNGGSSDIDKCSLAFSTSLEEIGRCFYFMNFSNIPPVGTSIVIVFNGIRLVAETLLGEEVGYLPTRYNYLKFCIDSGFSYSGVVVDSNLKPTPFVKIDVTP